MKRPDDSIADDAVAAASALPTRAQREPGPAPESKWHGDATPVALALVCVSLACAVFFSSLVPALREEKSVRLRLEAEERKQEILRKTVEEDRRLLRGLRQDPQELLRALDAAGIAPPPHPPVLDPRDARPVADRGVKGGSKAAGKGR